MEEYRTMGMQVFLKKWYCFVSQDSSLCRRGESEKLMRRKEADEEQNTPQFTPRRAHGSSSIVEEREQS